MSNVGKIFTCYVVAGDDRMPDPRQLGRVKVLCPSIHGDNYNIKDIPWVQIHSQAGNIGFNSFNRPPPVGTQVRARLLNDSGHFEVISIMNKERGK